MKQNIFKTFKWIGLSFIEPLFNLILWKEPKKNGSLVFKKIIIPIATIFIFFEMCNMGSSYLYNIERNRKIAKVRADQGEAAAIDMQKCIDSGNVSCKPNSLPSPADVWKGLIALWADCKIISANKTAFENKTAAINEKRLESGQEPIKYTGRPSFIDQIWTSIKTVFAGFLLAAILGIPFGIVLGLSSTLRSSINWLIQIFKPVSPVVWLLLVSMVVKTVMANSDADKSFVISFIAVGLCCMWATLVNTTMGVSSVDKDYINVAKVLRLGVFKSVFKIILPASVPMIFTGLRISLSVAWMVLIAIELLAQSPGLGSFVWEEFQNGANDSNAKIIVAMFVIGLIGFMLDRIMLYIQKFLNFDIK